ncbi:MAG: hypothetical protein IJP79_07225 [Paludibacteraceae bacterium]|nr:hypothetical protein [Paludibacteraceae bacterium]MBQ6963475.1 hypothetical protein [Paludibacteraceae bacterium]MBQ7662511.1 hypothetical protein [Prevotella sp.]
MAGEQKYGVKIEVTSDTSKAEKGLDNIGKKAQEVGEAVNQAFNLDEIKRRAEEVANSMSMSKAKKELSDLKTILAKDNELYDIQGKTIEGLNAKVGRISKTLTQYKKNLDALKKNGADPLSIGQAQHKVDELEGALHSLQGELSQQEVAHEELGQAIAENTAYVDAYKRKIEESDSKQVSMRQRLREIREEMQLMAMSGKEDTDEFRALQAEGAKITGTIGDINQSMKAMASDEIAINTVVGSFQLLSGVVSTAAGAISAFSDDEETLMEVQKNLQSVIAVTTGLQSVQVALNKDGALISSIRALQEKLLAKATLQTAAATTASTTATKGATVAQRIFNKVAKANPYVLLVSAILAVGGALVAFASKTANAKEEQEKLNKELERAEIALKKMQAANRRAIEIAKASGATDEEIDKAEIDAAQATYNKRVEMYALYVKKMKEAGKIKVRKGATKIYDEDVDEEILDKYQQIKQERDDAMEAIKDAQNAADARAIQRQREYEDEVTRLSRRAKDERLKMLSSFTKNRITKINEEKDAEIRAIEEERKEFEKAQKQKGITNIDTGSFGSRIKTAKDKAKKEIENVLKEWSDKAKETNLSAEAKMLETENSLLRQQAELLDDENARTEALRAVRRKEHEERMKQITAERDAKLKALAEEGVDETTEEGKNLIAAVNKEANTKAYAENSMYTLNEQKEDIERIKQAAQQSIEIERGRLEEIDRLREMHKEGVITDKELGEGTAQVNANAAVEQKSVADRLGMTQEEITAVLQTVADSVLNASFEQIDTMLAEAEAHLAEIQAEGGEDSGEDLTALRLKIDALKLAKDRAKKNGSVADALAGKNSKKKMKEITSSVSDLADALEECGDSIGGTAGQAMKVMGNVLASSITVITGIQQVVSASTEGTKKAATTAETAIKTVETASVILAVISAAIQAAQQIMSLFDNDSEREEYEKAKAQYEDYISLLDAVIDKQLELADAASGKAASDLYDASVEYAEKAAEAARKMGHDYVRSREKYSHSEGVKQDENLTKEARREAEAVIKELGLNVTVSDLAGKSGKIFDLTAEQIRVFMQDAQYFYNQLRGDTKEYLDQIVKSSEQIEEINERTLKKFSNTTFDEMRDNFKSALGDMSEDAEDFSKSIKETLKDSVIDDVVTKEFEGRIKALRQLMSDYREYNNGALSELAVNDIVSRANSLDDEIKRRRAELAQTYQGLFDETTTQEGTSKGFEAMSQDTANELNGRFTALQITGANIDNKMTTLVQEAVGLREEFMLSVGIANNMLLELRGINANTALIADTNVRLRNIEEVLEDRL